MPINTSQSVKNSDTPGMISVKKTDTQVPQIAQPTALVRQRRLRPGKIRALSQCLELQQLCYDVAHRQESKGAEVAQLARAWEALEERKRILRNKPLPGSLKPEQEKRSKPTAAWKPND